MKVNLYTPTRSTNNVSSSQAQQGKINTHHKYWGEGEGGDNERSKVIKEITHLQATTLLTTYTIIETARCSCVCLRLPIDEDIRNF